MPTAYLSIYIKWIYVQGHAILQLISLILLNINQVTAFLSPREENAVISVCILCNSRGSLVTFFNSAEILKKVRLPQSMSMNSGDSRENRNLFDIERGFNIKKTYWCNYISIKFTRKKYNIFVKYYLPQNYADSWFVYLLESFKGETEKLTILLILS